MSKASGRCESCGTGNECGRQQRPHGWALAEIAALMAEATDVCQGWPEDNRDEDGYGYTVEYADETLTPHRVVCILAYGDRRAEGMVVRHLCGNASCVNKRHLAWGTTAENNLDRWIHDEYGSGPESVWKARTFSKVAHKAFAVYCGAYEAEGLSQRDSFGTVPPKP